MTTLAHAPKIPGSSGPLGFLVRLVEEVRRAHAASVEIRRLLDLPDTALAARGLKRDTVVAHVFKRFGADG